MKINDIRSFGTTSFYLVSGSVLAAASQWFVMVLIAREGGAGALGGFSLAQSYVVPLSYLAWLSIRQLVISDRENYRIADYFFLRATFPLLVWFFLIIAMLLGDNSYSLIAMTTAVAALKYSEGFFDLGFGIFQKHGRSHFILFSSIIRLFCLIAIFYLSIEIGLSITYGVANMALFSFLIFITFDIIFLRKFISNFGRILDFTSSTISRRKRLLVTMLPLSVSGAIMAGTSSLPRIVLSSYWTEIEVGHFAAVTQFVAISGILATSMGQAALPGLAMDVLQSRERSFWKKLALFSTAIIVLSFVSGVCAWAIGDWILVSIFGPQFSGLTGELIVGAIVAGPLMIGSIFAFAMTACALYGYTGATYVVVCAVSAVSCILLVPTWGATGALCALGIGAMSQIFAFIFFLRRYWCLTTAA